MVTPPRPSFMKSLFIFSVHILAGKKDNFEGCLKGVGRVFSGVAGCFKKIDRGVKSVRHPPPILLKSFISLKMSSLSENIAGQDLLYSVLRFHFHVHC